MLTTTACNNASCPPDKTRARLSDAGGLYLEVSASGSKRWFLKYRFDGKEKRLALGSFPDVTLKAAREGRDNAKRVLSTGADPVQNKKAEKLAKRVSAATTFESVAREYHTTKAPDWSSSHAKQWLRCCEKDLFPWIGSLPLRDITAPLLLEALRRVESRGATQLVRDLREYAGQVFRYGVRTGKCDSDPARDLVGAFKTHTVKHMAAVLDPASAGALLRAIEGYSGQPTTKAALQLSALLFQRPGNIRSLEWAWIDLDQGMLTIPSEAMKRTKAGKLNGRPHFVPLPRQAIAILRDISNLTGAGRLVFPSLRTGQKPMSENTVNAALRGLGYSSDQMTAHGFRAMARTIIAENIASIDPEVIEAQLAHGKSGPLGAAYDRAEFMEKRRKLMQTWADYLDQIKAASAPIPLQAA